MTLGFEALFNQIMTYTVYHSHRAQHADTKTFSGRLYHFNVTVVGTLTTIPLELLAATEQLLLKLPLVILSTPIKYSLAPISATAKVFRLKNFSHKLDDTAAKLPGIQAIYLTAVKVVALSFGVASTTTIGLFFSTKANHTIHCKLGLFVPGKHHLETIEDLEKEVEILKQFDGIDALKQSAEIEKKSLLQQMVQKNVNYDLLVEEKEQLEKEKNVEIEELRKELHKLRSTPQPQALAPLPAPQNDQTLKIKRLQHRIAEQKKEIEVSKQIAVEKENESSALAKKVAWIPELQDKIQTLHKECEVLNVKHSADLDGKDSNIKKLKIEKDREIASLKTKIIDLENELYSSQDQLIGVQINKERVENQNKMLRTALEETPGSPLYPKKPVGSPLALSNRTNKIFS